MEAHFCHRLKYILYMKFHFFSSQFNKLFFLQILSLYLVILFFSTTEWEIKNTNKHTVCDFLISQFWLFFFLLGVYITIFSQNCALPSHNSVFISWNSELWITRKLNCEKNCELGDTNSRKTQDYKKKPGF